MSKEGTVHEVPMAAAKLSHLIATTIEDIDDPYGNDNEVQEVIDDDHEIPLPNISDVVLTKIIEYCNHYTIVEAMTAIETPLQSIKIEELVQSWYADFVAETDHEVLFELVTASNFMDIKPLLDLTCLAVSSVIKGQTCQNLRQMFDSDDLTPEEETQVRVVVAVL